MPKFFQYLGFLPGQTARSLGTKGTQSFLVLLSTGFTGKFLSVLTSRVFLPSPYSCQSLHTFSFIFSIFFTELLRTCFSSMRTLDVESGERGVCRSSCLTDFPICFSSCFSASFSLLWALMLSALYMWYVFMTCKTPPAPTPRGQANGVNSLFYRLRDSAGPLPHEAISSYP